MINGGDQLNNTYHSFAKVIVSLVVLSKLFKQVSDRDMNFRLVNSQCDLLRS